MTTHTAIGSSSPFWIRSAINIATFGDPDLGLSKRRAHLWQEHFNEMHADPQMSAVQLFAEVVRSLVGHAVWRITMGPPTTVSLGAITILCGALGLFLAFSSVYELSYASAGSGTAGVVGGMLMLAEAKSSNRHALTRCLWACSVLVLLIAASDLIVNPEISGDRPAGFGFVVIALALMPLALLQRRSSDSWKQWLVVGLGMFCLAFSNLLSTQELTDQAAARIATLLFIAESAAGVAVIRWALCRRLLRKTPNQATILTQTTTTSRYHRNQAE